VVEIKSQKGCAPGFIDCHMHTCSSTKIHEGRGADGKL